MTGPDGTGVNLASVVALWPSGTAISGMTRPDGTYRIEGVPPGQYFVLCASPSAGANRRNYSGEYHGSRRSPE